MFPYYYIRDIPIRRKIYPFECEASDGGVLAGDASCLGIPVAAEHG